MSGPGMQFIEADGTSLESEADGEGSLLARSSGYRCAVRPGRHLRKMPVIIVVGDAGQPDDHERRIIGSGSITWGIGLACWVKPSAGLVARRAQASGAAVIRESLSAMAGTPDPLPSGVGLYGMAIDIGTMTIAAYLVDFGSHRVTATASRLNSQRAYGAYVIARIEYAGRVVREYL